ncbi:hypothetical protein MMC28_008738 [Mycoblastus sanguinarius]|nr:hypothetical protein [Mycoblastus sanguinarius]
MAKSLRSSRKKVNKSKLRSNVFGPVENARKERLSTKLLELATNPQSRTEDGSRTMDEAKEPAQQKEAEPDTGPVSGEEGKAVSPDIQLLHTASLMHYVPTTDMDIGQAKNPSSTAKSISGKLSRVQKRERGKARAAMVFPVYKKGRKVGPHLTARQRRKSLRP